MWEHKEVYKTCAIVPIKKKQKLLINLKQLLLKYELLLKYKGLKEKNVLHIFYTF